MHCPSMSYGVQQNWRKPELLLLGNWVSWRTLILIRISSNSGDSKDGDSGDSGINDYFITSNSNAKSSSEPTCKIFAMVVLQLVYFSNAKKRLYKITIGIRQMAAVW